MEGAACVRISHDSRSMTHRSHLVTLVGLATLVAGLEAQPRGPNRSTAADTVLTMEPGQLVRSVAVVSHDLVAVLEEPYPRLTLVSRGPAGWAPLPNVLVPGVLGSIAATGSHLSALDIASNKIHVFRRVQNRVIPDSVWTVRDADAICAFDDQRYFVYSRTSGSAIHTYERQRGLVRSFGASFGTGGPLKSRAMSQGTMLCLKSQALIVVAADLLGEIRAYSPEGALVWSTPLADFRRVAFLGDGERSVTIQQLPDGAHSILGLAEESTGEIRVHLGYQRNARGAQYDSLHSIILDPKSGRQAPRVRSRDHFRVDTPRGSFSVTNHPTPAIIFWPKTRPHQP